MIKPDAAVLAALANAPYHKSSRSSATGNCLLAGAAGAWVGLQDSKEHPDSTTRATIAATRQQWAAFLQTIKAGHLDI